METVARRIPHNLSKIVKKRLKKYQEMSKDNEK